MTFFGINSKIKVIKVKLFMACLIATVMVFGMSVSAFAAEVESVETHDVQTRANTPVSGIVSANGSRYFYPSLESYVGVSRSFSITTASMSTQNPAGQIRVYLYRPNGQMLDYWVMSANDSRLVSYTLPPSGQYTLYVESEVKETVNVSATWASF